MIDISILIVNYNVRCFTEHCLLSVLHATASQSVEIIVADNASTDNSREYLEERFPTVRFIWLPENLGFAKANNLAMQAAQGQYFLLLNPDTLLPEKALQQALDFMQSHPEAGALGFKMIDGAGRYLKESKRGFPSPLASFFKLSGLAALFPTSSIVARYYAGHLSINEVNPVDALAGAAMLVRREVWQQTQGFDERFFMYAEDIDWSYRIREAGWQCYYFPRLRVLHFKGESTQKQSRAYVNRFYGAMWLFVQKHYAKRTLLKAGMYLSIALGRTLAGIKYAWLSVFHTTIPANKQPLPVFVVANQSSFTPMVALIQQSERPLQLQGRIAIHATDQAYSKGLLQQLDTILQAHPVAGIVFNLSDTGYESCLYWMEQLPNRYQYFFYSASAKSIISSADKNNPGWVIEAPSMGSVV